MADLGSSRVFGKLTVMHDAILKANAEITGSATAASFAGDGSLITALNAAAIATGTVPDARLPTTATRWPSFAEVTGKPSTYPATSHTHPVSQVTGLSDAATTTVATIRAGTTAANVGLGNVNNVPSPQADSIINVGLASNNIANPYMRQTSSNNLVLLATQADTYKKTEFTDAATANTPMVRNGNGDVWARLFRSNYSSTNSNIAAIYTTQTIGGDYMRPSTPEQVKASLGVAPPPLFDKSLFGGV